MKKKILLGAKGSISITSPQENMSMTKASSKKLKKNRTDSTQNMWEFTMKTKKD